MRSNKLAKIVVLVLCVCMCLCVYDLTHMVQMYFQKVVIIDIGSSSIRAGILGEKRKYMLELYLFLWKLTYFMIFNIFINGYKLS